MVENHHTASFRPPAAKRWWPLTAILLMGTMTTPTILEAQNANSIRYTVRFPAPASHYVSVEARLPVQGQSAVEVFIPVWTPGSYLVREFARNVEAIQVTDGNGRTLPFANSRKNRWRVDTGGAAEIRGGWCARGELAARDDPPVTRRLAPHRARTHAASCTRPGRSPAVARLGPLSKASWNP